MSRGIQFAVKRLFDIGASLSGLLALSPFLVPIAVAVKLDTGGPVLFKQARLGKDGKRFNIYKFRTMRDTRDANGKMLPDAVRLTRFGQFLRRTSLDELPELINVLRGEMSLVGPRPLLAEYAGRYTPAQARRHEVKPGITGLAQVRGRNVLSWEEKFVLDAWYVDHWSFWLDLKLMAVTVAAVLRGEGINEPGQATAQEFMGTLAKGRGQLGAEQ